MIELSGSELNNCLRYRLLKYIKSRLGDSTSKDIYNYNSYNESLFYNREADSVEFSVYTNFNSMMVYEICEDIMEYFNKAIVLQTLSFSYTKYGLVVFLKLWLCDKDNDILNGLIRML